ncbi:AIS_HP2_G0021520.mRNA.1.CDS.1 [Saccharomyces cerevisiae]|nr:AIS_HP2_G0021520.mRNA.1.CDS.1 [Saccharomyces cerevisiae]CAI6538008.1 AIS_HP2_G0021520.mRNA.1.CDS.1 [Saccharomyces cerevisiae]
MTVGEVAVGGKGDFKVYTSAKEEELNMMFNFKDLPRSRARKIEQIKCAEGTGTYAAIKRDYGEDSEKMRKYLKALALISRDHGRTSLPWNGDEP